MKRTIWIATVFLLLAGMTAGIHFATEGDPIDPSEQPLEQPAEEQVPYEPQVLGFCSGAEPQCNSQQCTGPNCVPETCDIGTNTGWSSCCDNGRTLDCGGGSVIEQYCECGGGICGNPSIVRYYCV